MRRYLTEDVTRIMREVSHDITMFSGSLLSQFVPPVWMVRYQKTSLWTPILERLC